MLQVLNWQVALVYVVFLNYSSTLLKIQVKGLTCIYNHSGVDDFGLPLTGKGVVNRIITDLGMMDISTEGVKLVELAQDVMLEQIKAATGVELILDAVAT